jgi:ribonuclease E|tara:strand:- start:3150 stop:5585 length:2436 start_codon:yes stop_codon:yes gene_type:complete
MTNKDQKILINVEDDETRIAFINGSKLENLHIEQTHRSQKVGNIYCGKVIKVQPSFQAAFINYGEARHGFLSLSDINFQVYKPNRQGRGKPSISQVLKPGQKILVQVIKDEIAHKGATLTTNISLAGRFIVYMPDSDRGGVSRKIEDEEQRTRLRHLLKGLGSEDASAIIRTVGVDRSLTELKRDFTNLRRTWNEIKSDHDDQSIPGLLYQEEDAIVRMIRDFYHDNVTEVVIDEPIAFQHVLEFFQAQIPKDQKKLQLYLGEKSLFASYEIEEQIEVLHQNKVPLSSGGSIIITQTEALVAIDVNSGRSAQEKNIESTAFRTNMEAAEEVSRQLRLRNMGGLIVVDFIDMGNSKNRLAVEQKMEEELAADKSKTSVSSISKFGLMELSRQRISAALSLNSTVLTIANRILRKIHDSVIDQKVLQVHLRLPLKLATHLLNVKRQLLTQMEIDFGVQISITPDLQLGAEEIPEMEITIKEQNGEEKRTSVPISAADIRDEKPARKKGRSKKETDKNDLALSEPEIPDKNIIEEQVNAVEEADLKSKTEVVENKSGKDQKTGKTNLDKKFQNVQEKTGTSKQEIISDSEENKKNNQIEKEPASTEVSKGVIYMSVHEPLAKHDSKGEKTSATEYSLGENTKYEKSIYSSAHQHGENHTKNNISKYADETISKDNFAESNMYSSVHLADKKLIEEKELSLKNPADKSSKSQKSKAKTAKKSTKKNQLKSIKNKSAANESNVHDEVKKEKTVKSQSESKLSSGTKSKNLKKEGTVTKKAPQKSKKPASRNREKVNASKSNQATRPRNKTVNTTKS